MDKIAKTEPKKPYSTPSLTVHGTVRELTQKKGTRNSPDGGGFPKYRTSA